MHVPLVLKSVSDLFAADLLDAAYRKFSLPPSLGYLCDRCIGPYFHTCQSPTLLYCFGQVMHNLGNRVALIFSSLDFSIPQSLGVWYSLHACDCTDCSGLTGLIRCWGDA